MRYDLLTVFLIVVAVAVLSLGGDPEAADRKVPRARVPAPVLAAFAKAYPNASVRGYGSEVESGVRLYEIESVEGGLTRDLLYRADGTVVEIEEGVSASTLPTEAAQTIARLRPAASIRTVERVTRADTTRFEVVVAQGRKRSKLTFDTTGRREQ